MATTHYPKVSIHNPKINCIDLQLTKAFLEHLGPFLGNLIYDLIDDLQPKNIDCQAVSAATSDNSTQLKFDNDLQRKLSSHAVLGYNQENDMVYAKVVRVNSGTVQV